MLTSICCYTCDEILSGRRETFYLYQCPTCLNKTPYCLRCNKTMDALLNGIFFKCFSCKVLNKIIYRESVSPEHETNIQRLLFPKSSSDRLGTIEDEIRGLFHPNITYDTPIRNLIIDPNLNGNARTINEMFNSVTNTQKQVNQNLLRNFNQAEIIHQTPKNEYRYDRQNIMFSPEDHFQRPIARPQTSYSEQEHSLKNLAMGFSTPRNNGNIQYQGNTSGNRRPEEGGITMDDFNSKLILQTKDNPNVNSNIQNISNNYTILAGKSSIGKVMGNARKVTPTKLEINKSFERSDADLFGTKTSEFAGYNKTERSSASKSPLSLRKKKKTNSPGVIGQNSLFLSANKMNSSVVNFNESNIQYKPPYGIASYLSDIKPINDYTVDASRYIITSENPNRFANLSSFSTQK